MNHSSTLVFRWVGKHIEGKLRKGSNPARLKLSPENRLQYLRVLHKTLEEGLYAQAPKNDSLGDGFFKTTLPCLCFTESSIRVNPNHCREYGRMAFGVSKQFIAKHGGGPVHYTLGTEKDVVTRRLKRLRAYFEDKELGKELIDFDYLTHFFKRLRPEQKSTKGKRGGARKVAKHRLSKEDQAMNAARFPKLVAMPYLSETEWRLVCPFPILQSRTPRWHSYREINDEQKKIPNAKFRISPGDELQIIILPDNGTIKKVLECSLLTSILFKSKSTPVQLISLDALSRLP